MKLLRRTAVAVFGLGVWHGAATARAGLWDYVTAYQPGVAYGTTVTSASISYTTPAVGPAPAGCGPVAGDRQEYNCSVSMSSHSTVPLSVFLQQPFKRTGWLYFDDNLKFTAYDNDATLAPDKNNAKADAAVPEQPLTEARLHLYGVESIGYLTFGITPPRLAPDLMVSLGIGDTAMLGNIEVQGDRQTFKTNLFTEYVGAEIVWLRFHRKGWLSSSLDEYANANSQVIYRASVGGMTNVRVTPSMYSLNLLKVVFAGWP